MKAFVFPDSSAQCSIPQSLQCLLFLVPNTNSLQMWCKCINSNNPRLVCSETCIMHCCFYLFPCRLIIAVLVYFISIDALLLLPLHSHLDMYAIVKCLIFYAVVSHLEPNKTLCVTMETEAALNPSVWIQVCVFIMVAVKTVHSPSTFPPGLRPVRVCLTFSVGVALCLCRLLKLTPKGHPAEIV